MVYNAEMFTKPALQPRPTTTPTVTVPRTITPTTTAVPGGTILPSRAPTTPTTPPGFQDIRSQLVGYQPNQLAQQANNQLSLAMAQAPGQMPQMFGPVAGPNYGQANDYLSQAAAYARGVNPGSIGSGGTITAQQVGSRDVAGPNFGQATSLLEQALAASSSPEAQALRAKLMGQFDGLSSSPDRLALAADALRIQRDLTQPQWEADLRSVGQKAAALGRVGAGMTTTELNDVTLAREKNLNLLGQQLANQASGQILQDRLNVFGAGAGLQGQFSGQDMNRAGLMSNLGGQYAGMAQATTANAQQNAARALQAAMANQGASLSADESNASRALAASQARASLGLQQAGLFSGLGSQAAGMATNTAQFGAQQQAAQIQQAQQRAALQQALLGQLAGIQGQQFQQGMAETGLRTQQQQWQNTLQQQGVNDAMRQQVLQDQLLNSQFNRQLAAASAAGQYGFGNDPFSLQLAGSQYQQQNANSQAGALAALAQQQALAQQLAAMGRTGSPAPTAAPAGYYGQQPGTSYYGN